MDILAEGPGRGVLSAPLSRALVEVIPGQPGSGVLGVATLVSWAVTASLGGYMLRTWIARGGLQRRRLTGDGPPPKVVFTHFGLAVTGLVLWAAFVASDWAPLAWTAAALLMPVFGLGISTLTLWTPYPAPRPRPALPGPDGTVAQAPGPDTPGSAMTRGMLGTPAEDLLAWKLTDEVLARALTDDVVAGRLAEMAIAHESPAHHDARGHLAPLLAMAHGFAAITTVLLAILAVVSTLLPCRVGAGPGEAAAR